MSTFTETTAQKARKRHRCTWCWEFIEPGEQYKRYRYFDGGDAGTVKLHPECHEAMLQDAAEWGPRFEWTPGQERPAKKEAV
jgi:hypothetical protein